MQQVMAGGAASFIHERKAEVVTSACYLEDRTAIAGITSLVSNSGNGIRADDRLAQVPSAQAATTRQQDATSRARVEGLQFSVRWFLGGGPFTDRSRPCAVEYGLRTRRHHDAQQVVIGERTGVEALGRDDASFDDGAVDRLEWPSFGVAAFQALQFNALRGISARAVVAADKGVLPGVRVDVEHIRRRQRVVDDGASADLGISSELTHSIGERRDLRAECPLGAVDVVQ